MQEVQNRHQNHLEVREGFMLIFTVIPTVGLEFIHSVIRSAKFPLSGGDVSLDGTAEKTE